MTRLYRTEEDRILGGVCGGIAEKYDLDPSLVRLATVLLFLGAGVPLVLYLAAWIVVPPKSEVEDENKEEEEEKTDTETEEDQEE
jgi:phage shock protein PspC (stress-responsive transcriptional regulator)